MLTKNLVKKFFIMTARTKISYAAFKKKQTVKELILQAILDVYNERNRQGLIRNPYPLTTEMKGLINIVEGNSDI